MKVILSFILVLVTSISFGQKLKFKIENYDMDTTVNLVRYFGKGLYYADTAVIKNGVVEFDASKQKAGILALFLPGQNMLEFVYNNEDVTMEATYPDLMGTAVVKKSEENKIFHAYVQFISSERKKANGFLEQRKGHDEGSEMYKTLTDQMNQTTENVEEYQAEIVKNHWDKLVARIVKMSMDVEIPDAPTDVDGNIIDSNFRFLYFRNHFFDNIDLTDDRLIRTPIFHTKLAKYFSKEMMFQHPDTVIRHAVELCDRLKKGSDAYHYIVSWITSSYEKSKIMGMDKVFVVMADRYYITKNEEGDYNGFWVPIESMKKIEEKVKTNKNLVLGAIPPNIILQDSTDAKWRDFYSLDSEYTILYFWDPNCGHCKKITPKLQELYAQKFRDRNIEIFAIGKAVGEEFEKWKKFIRDNNLEFINVGVTDRLYTAAMDKSNGQAKLKEMLQYTTIESLNYQQTYDIYTTPRVFILDKDKKIIAKSLSVSQLEDLLDRLQGMPDLEKIFPPEEEDPEESQMH
ncbi:MAG: DUF5106 domain-containing protein [Crocinitomicaceae bacterium]|nr:DUF5106 domain-containing protein [Crocinitomicaceae bacterium]